MVGLGSGNSEAQEVSLPPGKEGRKSTQGRIFSLLFFSLFAAEKKRE